MLSICLLNYSFVYFYIYIDIYRYRYQYLESRHSSDNVGAAGNVSVCVCLFSQAVPQLLCTGCLCCPAANSPTR